MTDDALAAARAAIAKWHHDSGRYMQPGGWVDGTYGPAKELATQCQAVCDALTREQQARQAAERQAAITYLPSYWEQEQRAVKAEAERDMLAARVQALEGLLLRWGRSKQAYTAICLDLETNLPATWTLAGGSFAEADKALWTEIAQLEEATRDGE